MNVVFCGGASEVGASCYLVRIDNKNIVLDCGIRMKGQDPLPNLRQIQQLGGADAIIVSHAHLDHTGALPILSREYPQARIYMTHASKALTQVLLYDSLKIMDRNEADIPIYAEAHVRAMLDQIVCYSPQYPFAPFPGDKLTVTFYNAGHVAGSVMAYIQGKEGTVLYTGDFSVVDQHTVAGASIPKLRPDVLIMESTYGDELHANRSIEEERLVTAVQDVVKKGGKVLFPSFALGRAQELLLILRRARNKKQLPEIPIYVDGMVRAINQVYQNNPNYLRNTLAKKVFRGQHLFYDEDETISPVGNGETRKEILAKPGPYCVIASSGMLKGGPSTTYAMEFAKDAKNLIGITGYQDEEAPGREIMNILRDMQDNPNQKAVLSLNNQAVPIQCALGRYGLSAHADKTNLLGVAHRVTPRHLFLVHGDFAVTSRFAAALQNELRGRVYVPSNGEEYEIQLSNPRKQVQFEIDVPSLHQGASKLDEANLRRLWEHVHQHTGVERGYTVEELHWLWTGQSQLPDAEAQSFMGLLNGTAYFSANSRKLFLFHPASREELRTQSDRSMEVNQMIQYVKELFPADAGLIKVGARIADRVALLSFHFPALAAKRYEGIIEGIHSATGWTPELNTTWNLEVAQSLVEDLLPPTVAASRYSFFQEQHSLSVVVNGVIEEKEDIVEQFRQRTGLELKILEPGQRQAEQQDLEVRHYPQPMEQNRALAYVQSCLEHLGLTHFKKGRKVHNGIPYIEVSFISPQIGNAYSDQLRGLAEDIGWSIMVGKNPNQAAIIQTAVQLCRQYDIGLRKNPSIFVEQALVRIQPIASISDEAIQQLQNEFRAKTGYELVAND